VKKQVSVYILSFLSLIIIGYGCLYIFRRDIMSYHSAFLGMSEDQLMVFNQRIIPLYLTLIWIVGSCMIAIGLSSLILVIGPLRQGYRWAWWILMALLPIPLFITALLSYKVAHTIPSGPKPPYWLAAGILVVFLAVIGFCYPRRNRS
jgi:hypothetical protein